MSTYRALSVSLLALSLTATLVGCSGTADGAAPAPWAPGPTISCRYTLVENSTGSVGGYTSSSTDRTPTCNPGACRDVRTPSTYGSGGFYGSYYKEDEVELVGSCSEGAPADCSERKGKTACETAVFASCCKSFVIAEQDPNETRMLDCITTCPSSDDACVKACTDGAPAASLENLSSLLECIGGRPECTN